MVNTVSWSIQLLCSYSLSFVFFPICIFFLIDTSVSISRGHFKSLFRNSLLVMAWYILFHAISPRTYNSSKQPMSLFRCRNGGEQNILASKFGDYSSLPRSELHSSASENLNFSRSNKLRLLKLPYISKSSLQDLRHINSLYRTWSRTQDRHYIHFCLGKDSITHPSST